MKPSMHPVGTPAAIEIHQEKGQKLHEKFSYSLQLIHSKPKKEVDITGAHLRLITESRSTG
jgi:hypothetical protein